MADSSAYSLRSEILLHGPPAIRREQRLEPARHI